MQNCGILSSPRTKRQRTMNSGLQSVCRVSFSPSTTSNRSEARAVPQRPIIAVYHHVRRKHHEHARQGAWTDAQDAALKQWVSILSKKYSSHSYSQSCCRSGAAMGESWRACHAHGFGLQGQVSKPYRRPRNASFGYVA